MSTIHIPGSRDDVVTHRQPTLLSSILAIAFIALLIGIVLWGLVHLVSLVRGTKDPIDMGSWFTSKPTLVVRAPKEVTSGSVTSISWDFTPSTTGSYTFSYECSDGASVHSASDAHESGTSLPCSTAVNASTTKNTISIVPISHVVKDVSIPLSIFFVPDNGSTPTEGTATILVHAAPSTTTDTDKGSVAKDTATTTDTKIATPADLSVSIVSVGVIDPSTGQFVAGVPSALDAMAAVQFDIANTGETASGSWYFEADLPTMNGYHYVSPSQASLTPGKHILNTLRFTQVASGGGIFTVTIHRTGETNTTNNTASTVVTAVSYQ